MSSFASEIIFVMLVFLAFLCEVVVLCRAARSISQTIFVGSDTMLKGVRTSLRMD